MPAGRIREIVGWGGDNVNGVQVVYDVEGVAVRGPKHMGEHGLYRQSSLVLDVAGGEVRGVVIRYIYYVRFVLCVLRGFVCVCTC